jgi:hypothetical protein
MIFQDEMAHACNSSYWEALEKGHTLRLALAKKKSMRPYPKLNLKKGWRLECLASMRL